MNYGKQRLLVALPVLLYGVLLSAQIPASPEAPSTLTSVTPSFCDVARKLRLGCPGNPANLALREERERRKVYVTLQRGTPIHLRLTRSYSSREHRPGEGIEFRLTAPVRADGILVLPAGAIIWGYVDAGTRKDGFCRRGGRLNLSVDHADAITGETIPLLGGTEAKGIVGMESRTKAECVANKLAEMLAGMYGITVESSDAFIPVDTLVEAYVESDVVFDLEAATQVAIRLGYLKPQVSSIAADEVDTAAGTTRVAHFNSQATVPPKKQP